ncbi:aquaporin [Streptacidiphilus jiangxiensis]|uniref:Aquaporin Z n=1 Tax=Streptacidiphilus jiangxiensis TaxID=235985 RepID=A0A1H7UD27_STRJI|nr:aquaporin [Streptacidiphilus jiangxiensis]SEL94605.1 aquaporin Z [Streptacidiphilus jiangxiensis]
MGSASRIFLAEAVGTAILIVGGVGTAVLDGDKAGVFGVALAFGLSLAAAAYLIGPISGCHINPAITAAMVVVKKTDARLLPSYLGGQVVGGLFGALLIWAVGQGMPGFTAVGVDGQKTIVSVSEAGFASNGYGVHSPDHYNLGSVMLAEVVATAVFALVVLGTTRRGFPVAMGGLIAGAGLALVHLVTIPVSNTSVNPARSLATAVFQGGWALSQLWVFIVFPLIGGTLAGAAWLVLGRAHEAAAAVAAHEAEPVPAE